MASRMVRSISSTSNWSSGWFSAGWFSHRRKAWMATGQEALVVFRLGHHRGRRSDPPVRPPVVQVGRVEGRRGPHAKNLLAVADHHSSLLERGRRLDSPKFSGDVPQRSVAHVLPQDPTLIGHSKEHLAARAIEQGAKRSHRRP